MKATFMTAVSQGPDCLVVTLLPVPRRDIANVSNRRLANGWKKVKDDSVLQTPSSFHVQVLEMATCAC